MSSRFWLSLSALVAYSGSVIANPTGLSRRAFNDAGEEKFCDEVMCIQGEVMGNTIQYTLSSRGSQPTGWMAIGFGEAMKGSPMVIMWPNRDGSFTMSQRKAPYETEPALDPNPPFQASFLPHSSFVQDKLVTMAFSMPLDPSEDRHTKQIIWAFGRTHPEPEVDANLKFHYRWGTTTLILSNASDDGEEATVPDPATTVEHPVEDGIRPEPDALPLLPYQKTIIAHATLSVIGFLILLPAGALVPRYLRAKYPAWVTLHWVVQVLAGGFNIACSFAAAYRAVSRTGAGHFNDVHKRLGALLLALYVAQCLGGTLKHRLQISSPAVSRLHVALGLSIIILAFYQTRIGYTSEWTSATGLAQLPAINFIWWTLIIAIPVLYATGIVFPGQKAINLSISRKSDREAVAAESVPLRATEGEDCGDYMETPHLERPSKAE